MVIKLLLQLSNTKICSTMNLIWTSMVYYPSMYDTEVTAYKFSMLYTLNICLSHFQYPSYFKNMGCMMYVMFFIWIVDCLMCVTFLIFYHTFIFIYICLVYYICLCVVSCLLYMFLYVCFYHVLFNIFFVIFFLFQK